MTKTKRSLLPLAAIAVLGTATLTAAPAAAERVENRVSSIERVLELEAERATPGSKAGDRQTAAAQDRGTTDAFAIGSGGRGSGDWRRSHFGFDGGR